MQFDGKKLTTSYSSEGIDGSEFSYVTTPNCTQPTNLAQAFPPKMEKEHKTVQSFWWGVKLVTIDHCRKLGFTQIRVMQLSEDLHLSNYCWVLNPTSTAVKSTLFQAALPRKSPLLPKVKFEWDATWSEEARAKRRSAASTTPALAPGPVAGTTKAASAPAQAELPEWCDINHFQGMDPAYSERKNAAGKIDLVGVDCSGDGLFAATTLDEKATRLRARVAHTHNIPEQCDADSYRRVCDALRCYAPPMVRQDRRHSSRQHR